MAQQTMHAQMGSAEELIHAGAITFGLEYRTLHEGTEAGVWIHICGDEIDGQDKKLLRFDCFWVAPHYRNSYAKKYERLMLGFTAEGDPLAWTLDKI